MSVFSNLIDQDATIISLQNAVAASKDESTKSQAMTHAWLFTGPPGSGKQ